MRGSGQRAFFAGNSLANRKIPYMPETRRRRPPAASDAIDENLVKALSHPLRQRILHVLNTKVSSPKEIAAELDEKVGDVGYHVRILADLGAIELVRTEQRRGAVKHFYRATTRAMLNNAEFARLPISARRGFHGENIDAIWQHIRGATEAGGFDREDVHVSWTWSELDERGYAQMVKLLDQTLEKALAIQAAAIDRHAKGTSVGTTVKTEVVLMHYLPDGEPAGEA
jgi:DNA-binding transcriptional ArsR family regulator